MGNNSVPKFIFRLSKFPVYRGSVLGRFYCTWTCCRLCSDDVPGYGEDGSQSTPVTRSDKQEHDGKPH